METNELRIGNWIHEPNNEDKSPFQVWGTYCENINSKINNFPQALFEPIQITEKWLLKFGFKGDSLTGLYVCYKLGYFKIWHDNKNNTFLIDNVKEIKLFIKYVHQLQNLYFALTGKELTTKN